MQRLILFGMFFIIFFKANQITAGKTNEVSYIYHELEYILVYLLELELFYQRRLKLYRSLLMPSKMQSRLFLSIPSRKIKSTICVNRVLYSPVKTDEERKKKYPTFLTQSTHMNIYESE
jgi:hypothetical protein